MAVKVSVVISSTIRYGSGTAASSDKHSGRKHGKAGGVQEDGGDGTDPVGVHAKISICFDDDKPLAKKPELDRVRDDLNEITSAINDAVEAYYDVTHKLWGDPESQ